MVSVYAGTKEGQREGTRESGRMMLKGKGHLLQAGNFKGQLFLIAFIFSAQCKDPEHSLEEQQKAKVLERKDDMQPREE